MTARGARGALVLALILLCAGYLVVYRPLESQIADRYAQLDDVRATLEREHVIRTETAALEHDERELSAWVVASRITAAPSASVTRFLQLLDAQAAADHVTIAAIGGATVTPPLLARPPSPPSTAAAAFEEVPLSLTVHGSYTALLQLVRDLARSSIPARIGITAMGSTSGVAHPAPELHATLHVTLLHATLQVREAARVRA